MLAGNRGALTLILGFLVLLIPVAADGQYFFGDERFYTDGATRMVLHGDILTPHYIDGLPHFNKPILAYWGVLGSFELFGIGVFASRLPSLLAGGALLAFTYRCALQLLGRRDVALLAMAILGSNLIVIASATRATPDILLAAFMLASLSGFIGILLRGDKTSMNYALAYVGAGLALETKGLLALVAVLYVLAFWVVFRPRRARFGDLFERWSVTLGLVIGFSWFAIAAYQHGGAFWSEFIGDQITTRLDEGKVRPLRNVLFLLGATLQNFLPWTLFLAVAAVPSFGRMAAFWDRQRPACRFVGGWYVTLLLVFSATDLPRGRYLLPAFPLLAVVLAGLLMEVTEDARTATCLRRISIGAMAAIAVTGLVVLVGGAFIEPQVAIAGAVVLAGATLLLLAGLRETGPHYLVSLGIVVLLTLSMVQSMVRPVFKDAPEAALVEELLRRGARSEDVGMVDLPSHASSHISLFSAGQLAIDPLPGDVTWEVVSQYPVLLLSETSRASWSFDEYEITECGREYRAWSASDIWRLIVSRDKEAVFRQMADPYFIASRGDLP